VKREVTEKEVSDLKREMSSVRRELTADVDHMVVSAMEFTDWKTYVKAHPFACVGIALALGYLVVPQKTFVMSPTASQLESLAKKNHLVVKPSADASPPSPGWKSKLLAFGANAAMRTAFAYAGQYAGKFLGDEPQEKTVESETSSSPTTREKSNV
jgi:hypothetical protein